MEADVAPRKLADEARKGRVRDTAIVQKFHDATFQANAAFLLGLPEGHHGSPLDTAFNLSGFNRSEGCLRAVIETSVLRDIGNLARLVDWLKIACELQVFRLGASQEMHM
jgi:hypothetical protein